MKRRRDATLEATLLFRQHGGRTLAQLIAFLYICENEGLSVQELADVAQMTQSTASRSARALGVAATGWSVAPALGLVEGVLDPDDNRSHRLTLSEAGRRLRTRFDELIAMATPIADAS